MKFVSAVSIALIMAFPATAFPPLFKPNATPEQDVAFFRDFFTSKFPGLPDTEFANGMYAMDEVLRQNWEQIEEFPPYEPFIEDGETVWNTPFGDGHRYEECFGQPGVVHNYPQWNREQGEVVTLALAINQCRKKFNTKPLRYGKKEILALQAYMAYQSRGNKLNVVVPTDDPRALEAYNEGKRFYFSRRGQLSMACYHCHFDTAGMRIRANVLSPARGQATHWPAYRSKWGGMGGIHRRYRGCNKQVRAKPFAQQSREYRNLEYFHMHLSKGIELNGPGARF